MTTPEKAFQNYLKSQKRWIRSGMAEDHERMTHWKNEVNRHDEDARRARQDVRLWEDIQRA